MHAMSNDSICECKWNPMAIRLLGRADTRARPHDQTMVDSLTMPLAPDRGFIRLCEIRKFADAL